jgi:hypothetical protein
MEGGNLRLEGDTTALASTTSAMINPPAKPEPAWTGSASSMACSTGPATRTAARSVCVRRLAAACRCRPHLGRRAWDYSEDKDQATRDWKLNQRRAGGGIKYDYFLSKRDLLLLATTRVLGDTLADLDLRFTGGVGIGYTWIENRRPTFLTEVGLRTSTRTTATDTPSSDYLSASRGLQADARSSRTTTKLVHGVEAFPSTRGRERLLPARSRPRSRRR